MWDDPSQLNAVAAGARARCRSARLTAGALAWLVRQPAFEFREVVVISSPLRASAAHLRGRDPRRARGHVLHDELSTAPARRVAQVPWVRQAWRLRRQWPQRLEVTIDEHEPLRRAGTPTRS